MQRLRIVDNPRSILVYGSKQISAEAVEIISYELWCASLDHISKTNGGELTLASAQPIFIQAGIWDKLKSLQISKDIIKVFNNIKEVLTQIGKDFSLSLTDLVKAFKNKELFGIIKAFGFNFMTMFKSIKSITSLISKGLIKVFEEIHKTGLFQKIQKGLISADELLDKYPLLKKVGGVALAGLLLYIWINSAFIGDFDTDLDMSVIVAALHGSFSLATLFASPSGLMMLTLFATGFTGLSFPWLGASLYNLILGLLYTGFKKIRETGLAQKLFKHFKLQKV